MQVCIGQPQNQCGGGLLLLRHYLAGSIYLNANENILVLTIIDFTQVLNQRTHHIVRDLLDRGESVTVFFRRRPPACTFWQRFRYLLFVHPRKEKISDQLTYYSNESMYSPSGYFRVLGDIAVVTQMMYTLVRLIKTRHKLCIAASPWAGVAGIMLRKLGLIDKLVYEDLDYFPAFIPDRYVEKRFINWLEKLSVRHADVVISISEELAMLRRAQTNVRVEVVENGVDYSRFAGHRSTEPHPPTMIYVGSIEEWAGVDIPVKALPRIVERIPDIRYMVLGGGPRKFEKHFTELISSSDFKSHVSWLGTKKYSDLPKYLAEADIGIAVFQPIELMKYAFTLKIVEYMAAGIPIIATAIGETERVVSKAQSGVLIDYSVEQFADAVIELMQDTERRKIFSENGHRFAAQYDWDQLLEKEYTILKQLLRESS